MAEAASRGIGPDIVIIVNSEDGQAFFWQERLTGPDGVHGSGEVIKKEAIVISVTESNWQGGAGNALGTLNGFLQAAVKAEELGLIKLKNHHIDTLTSNLISYSRGKSVFMFHTAGKGTRIAPLPGAEANSKPNIKLPDVVNTKDGDKLITMLEAIMKVTSIYASTREDRLSVFWGDQIIINELDVSFSHRHHIEIFGELVPLEEDIKSYGVLIPGENGDCKVREKLPMKEVEKLLPEGEKNVFRSVGSFTVSLSFLRQLIELEECCLTNHKECLNTDPDWWQPLTSERDEYIMMMSQSGESEEESAAKWDQIQKVWNDFLETSEFTSSGLKGKIGFKDIGENSLWWDYGQNLYFLKNMQTLTQSSEEGRTAREFFSLGEDYIKDKEEGDLKVEDSVITLSSIKKGKLKNCVVIGSEIDEIEAENAVIISSRILKIKSRGALCYNIVEGEVSLTEGEVLVNVFCPEKGRIVMKTHIDRDGKKDWKEKLAGNEYSYSDIHDMMKEKSYGKIEKEKQKYIKNLE